MSFKKHGQASYPLTSAKRSVVFIARRPEQLADASSSGATIRQADYDDDNSILNAFEGVDTLFLISYASVEHEHRSERHRFAINAAIRSGVKHIFYDSLGYGGKPETKESVAHVMQPHLDTEKYLEELSAKNPGFGYTVVREGPYTESYPLYTAFFDPKNPVSEIKIPHDGPGPGIAWVKREELGEGTAELLRRFAINPAGLVYCQRSVLLSGARVLSLQESVDILGRVANVPVRIRRVSDEEFAAQPQVKPNFVYCGVDYSLLWATTFDAFRRGEAAYASSLLGELLGREPEDD
ncbi:uncharacterized protein DSM5745_05548 [Aspergillus mulundensis]|uniref:NmrA-like domain-containing protein n=1 Tax=Aspergillus mulundensis TaxID=1810919 RepID=A0A3D8RXH5_9EURO|nr:Uncharacterized protein DSM5745_05548 [Aspergillus mulundensis]RDW78696.1 Uncharacterized protein DSM5745_05548 [Aspergillus mulundensis]